MYYILKIKVLTMAEQTQYYAPEPTAPDALDLESLEAKSTDSLIEEAANIAAENEYLIEEIKHAKDYQVFLYMSTMKA